MALKELSTRSSATSPAKPIGRDVNLNWRCTESRILVISVCTACSEICDVCWAMRARLWNKRPDAVVAKGTHFVVLLVNSPGLGTVMEPVQAPVKVHLVVPSVEQLMLVGPDPVLQVTIVPLGLASA